MSDQTERRTIDPALRTIPCDYIEDGRKCRHTPTVASAHGVPRRWRICEEHCKPKYHPPGATGPHLDSDRYQPLPDAPADPEEPSP